MIRSLKSSDHQQLLQIYDACGLKPGVDLSRLEALVFESENREIQGFVSYHISGESADIIDIGVIPACQKKGVGTQLLMELFFHLHFLGVAEVFLEVSHLNHGALKLYQKVGFQEVGTRPQYYQSGIYEGSDALVMSKKIEF